MHLPPSFGPFVIGSPEWRAFVRAQVSHAMGAICLMIDEGATPRAVADFVLSLGIAGAAVSHSIEDAAHPGTFAEAVFDILAN